jgi:predicted AAA+ superfamily ATPase
MFEEFLAFRFKDGKLQPIAHPHLPSFESLLFIERQKEELKRNTLQFVKGYPANDALLWRDRGTGKSSLVKSMLTLFGNEGLRLIQVYKAQVEDLSQLYELLRDSKKRFILFFDDLSFEPEEDQYRLLKSMLDGDLEERPENVLVYATSNRRKGEGNVYSSAGVGREGAPLGYRKGQFLRKDRLPVYKRSGGKAKAQPNLPVT